MTLINKYSLSKTDITSLTVDTLNRNYLWIAFAKNSDNNCGLQKVSANNPIQKYFDIEVDADEITKVFQLGNYIYISVDDTTILGKKYFKTNPTTSIVDYNTPIGIQEKPVDITSDGTYTYFLTPGILSGENAKIIIYMLEGTYSETIDLTGVFNASAFTFDDNGEIWVITNTSPAYYIRVYNDSGWIFTINS